MSQKLKQKNKLSALDRGILNRIQKDIPFIRMPWCNIARDLKISKDTFLKRIEILAKKGIIRRISATFNPRELGFTSTLVAVQVKPSKINKVAKHINRYDEVTHNYRRDTEYNLWFTLVASSKRRISQIISQLKKDKDIDRITEFPAKRLFKINVSFKV